MTKIHWLNPANGDWTAAADWDAGTVPGAGDAAILGGTSAYTVTITTAIAVGSISITDASARLDIHAPDLVDTVTGNLSNAGTLALDDALRQNGSTLAIGGTLTNSGSVVLGNSRPGGATTLTVAHLVNSGSISLEGKNIAGAKGQATLDVTGDAAPSTLAAGVSISLTDNALLEFQSGGITSVANGAALTIDGTLSRLAISSDTTTNSALTGLVDNAGHLAFTGVTLAGAGFTNSGTYHADSSTLSYSGDFDNSGTFALDQFDLDGGTTVTVAGTLSNSGTLVVGGAENSTSASETLTVTHLIGTGEIDIVAFAFGDPNRHATLTVTSDAAPTVLHGTMTLEGNALLEYASGTITSIATDGSLLLDGTQARIANASDTTGNSALVGLTNNAGALTLEDGASLSLAGGSLSNSGTLTVETGIRFAGQNTVLTLAHLANTGSLVIQGDASNGAARLIVTGDAAPTKLAAGVSIELSGGSALLEYASGSIQNIAAGASLSIDGDLAFPTYVADASDPASNSALKGLTHNSGSFTISEETLHDTASHFQNDGTFLLDFFDTTTFAGSFTNGGTLTLNADNKLTISAGLRNTGTIGLTDSDTLTAGPLSNQGTIIAGDDQAEGLTIAVSSLNNTGSITLATFLFNSSRATQMNVGGTATNTGTVDVAAVAQFDATGPYMQKNGETIVDGTLTAQRISLSGGTLDGTGTVAGNVNDSAGLLSGGSFQHGTIGTLSVQGDLSAKSGTIGAILGDAGAASDVSVTGKVMLTGGTLQLDIVDPDSLAGGETFTILSFGAGMLHGKFAHIQDGALTGDGSSLDLGNGMALDAIYDNAGGQVRLQVVLTPHAVVDSTGSVAYHANDTLLESTTAPQAHAGDFI